MKRYEYVNVKNAGYFTAKCFDHRAAIDAYAAKGYRFVGYVPTTIDGGGRITSYDLIFEIDDSFVPGTPVSPPQYSGVYNTHKEQDSHRFRRDDD